MDDRICHVRSSKFVLLYHQLVSRLGTGTEEFGNTLRALVTRLTTDHPHHTLYPLLALINDKDLGNSSINKKPKSAASSRRSSIAPAETLKRKYVVADSILSELQVGHSDMISPNSYPNPDYREGSIGT